jgi:hypothetical protein
MQSIGEQLRGEAAGATVLVCLRGNAWLRMREQATQQAQSVCLIDSDRIGRRDLNKAPHAIAA